MTDFKNTFKQNSIMFFTFFVGGNLIKYMLDASNIWYAAGSFSLGGLINSFTAFIVVFLIFIFPFKPVRRLLWNNLFGKVYTNKNTVGSESATTQFKLTKTVTKNEPMYETLDQKLSKNISSTRVSDNHFIVKIK